MRRLSRLYYHSCGPVKKSAFVCTPNMFNASFFANLTRFLYFSTCIIVILNRFALLGKETKLRITIIGPNDKPTLQFLKYPVMSIREGQGEVSVVVEKIGASSDSLLFNVVVNNANATVCATAKTGCDLLLPSNSGRNGLRVSNNRIEGTMPPYAESVDLRFDVVNDVAHESAEFIQLELIVQSMFALTNEGAFTTILIGASDQPVVGLTKSNFTTAPGKFALIEIARTGSDLSNDVDIVS